MDIDIERVRSGIEILNTTDVDVLSHTDSNYIQITSAVGDIFDIKGKNRDDVVAVSYEVFPDDMDCKTTYDKYITKLMKVKSYLQRSPLDDNGAPSTISVECEEKISTYYGSVAILYHIRSYLTRAFNGLSSSEHEEVVLNVERKCADGELVVTPLHELNQYFLNQLLTYGAKRKIDGKKCYVYMPIIRENNFVHSYERKETIESFIWKCIGPTSEEESAKLYIKMTQPKDLFASVEKFLRLVYDHRFEDLNTDDNLWSFRNAAFRIDDLCWYPYDESKKDHPACKGKHSGHLDSSVSSCMFIDQYVDYEALHDLAVARDEHGEPIIDDDGYPLVDGFGIEIEEMEKILRHQKLSDEVINWKYALNGRCLYPINEHDKWAVFTYELGEGGCGKSAYIKMVMSLMPPDRVGVLSNSVRQGFPLQSLRNTRFFGVMDCDRHFNLDEGTLKSMACGEGVQIDIMYDGDGKTGDWTVVGAFAGNEFPPFSNAGGSVARRFVFSFYHEPVRKTDGRLFSNFMERNRPAFLYKIALMYRYYARLHGDTLLYDSGEHGLDFFPQYFKDTQKDFTSHSNPLFSFFEHYDNVDICRVKEDVDAYTASHADVKAAYVLYCDAVLGKKPKAFKTDYIRSTMNALSDSYAKYDERTKTFIGVRINQPEI